MVRHPDTVVLFIVLSLVGLGVTMVYSASCILALENFGNQYYYLQRQALFSLAGVFLMFVVMRIPYRFYYRLSYPILGIGLALLTLLHIPGFGRSIGGATRWLQAGAVVFQPSEVAKLAIVIFMSYSLSKKQEKIKTFSIGFLPNMLISLVALFLIMKEPDFGTSIMLVVIVLLMMFIAGTKVRYLFLTALGSFPIFYLLIARAEYRLARILVFLNPWIDPQRAGFQITQSFIAFGSGGLWGQGLGQGKQKLFFLPAPHTDFIYAVIGEELGFVGTALVLALFLILVWRGVRIAYRMTDPFGCLLAMGITAMLGIQALVNMGVTLGLLPTKGLPMPFVSYGGTSLLVSLIASGILLNISSSAVSERPTGALNTAA
ncbi:MAG: putative lipid II flippase FtsW [Deltaproteobacteria bacterium]|nr:putative lipid II flippase FtsW [Deltaproteobacteria bacterium]